MFQRQLARSARQLVAQSFESRSSQASRTSFRVAQSGNTRAVSGVRPYSASAEPAKEDAAAAEKAGEAKEEDPVQKELAAKKKEVTEVTVGR